MKKRGKKLNRSRASTVLLIIILGCAGFFMFIPILFTVVNAFKPLEEFFIFPPKLYVQHPTMDNFNDLFSVTANLWVPFSRYIFNSIFVSVVGTGGHIVLASTAAYVLAKHQFPGKSFLSVVILISMLFTSKIMYVPQYIVLAKLGWIDSYMALIAPVLAMSLGVFLMKQFMETVPDEILESAKIDGTSELGICWKIVMPSVKPAWITLMIFAFQQIWNKPVANMIFTEPLKTLPYVLEQISYGGMARAGVGAAAALLLLIPPVTLFIVFQSRIIQTMATSGIKG